MTFNDLFDGGLAAQFSSGISIGTVLGTIGTAALFSAYLYIVYLLTSGGTLYSRRFNVTMSLISLITAALILTMQSNLVLSLGMVGALSIVRFRTAIKEPRDLMFLFWSISVGIIVGGGLWSVAAILSLILTIGLVLFDRFPAASAPYIAVIACGRPDCERPVLELFGARGLNPKVKSRSGDGSRLDLVVEFRLKGDGAELLAALTALEGVEQANLLSHDGEINL